MATEPIIKVWCDICLGENDERTEAKISRAIIIGSAHRKQLDLCDDHQQVLLHLEDVLNLYGTTPTDVMPKPGTQRRAGAFTCPRCSRIVPTRGAASTHARSHHGVPLSVLEHESGLGPEPTNLIKCADCDSGYFEGVQGYAAHRLRMHGDQPQKTIKTLTGNGGRQQNTVKSLGG
jgi:hypothetical protein